MTTINGTNGSDNLIGTSSNDTLSGGNGQDSLDGGDGNDTLLGGNGGDTLDGSAGNDLVYGENGNDVAVYAMSENEGDTDFYDGGNGSDRLRLLLTQSQLNSTAVQTDIQAYQVFLANHHQDSTFHFTAFDLTAKNFEQLEIVIVPGGDNQAPEITSGETASEPENTAASNVVYQAAATDADGDTITWSLSGADAGAFFIDSATGAVTFTASPDYENPADADGDNFYQITVDAFDGEVHTTKAVTIDVTDVSGLLIIGDNNSNTLFGTPEDDTIQGLGASDALIGGAGPDILDGGLGPDFADYRTAMSGLTVDLLLPADNTGDALGDSYIAIENIRGSDFDDVLRGDNLNNALEGGPGADVLDGRGGFDIGSYLLASAAVTANLANPALNTGDALGDTYISIENLRGSDFDDTLVGDNNNNALTGGLGGDILNGGGGTDTAVYNNVQITSGVTADLADPTQNTGDAQGDTYISIENLRGSPFDDILRGDANPNTFEGLSGDDLIYGQGGFDQVIYAGSPTNATSGIDVHLADGIVTSGDASIGTDTLRSIEAVFGTSFADVFDATDFSGSSLNAGSFGAGGLFNKFNPGEGDDTIIGNGNTQLFYSNILTAGIIFDFFTGTVTGATAGTDTFSGVRYVGGSNFADTIIGDDNNQQVQGLAGNDTIYGNGGFDELLGQDGDDILEGGAGADNLDGGAGNDTLSYAGSAAAVTVNLATHTASGGDAEGDNLLAANFQSPGGIPTFENVRGSQFDDNLTGSGGDNILTGGGGNDTLTGEAGADTFVFTNITDSPGGGSFDTITDFVVNEDHLDLRGIDADTSSGIDDAFVFGGETNAVLANSVTWYQDGTDTIVQADVDGDATADMMFLLSGLQSLTSEDFLL